MIAHQQYEYRKGVILTLFCYLIWGLFPIYWYPLGGMDPYQLMAQRVCWSLLFIFALLYYRGEGRIFAEALKNRKVLLMFLLSSMLLAINWTTYLWAISSNRVLDASLGYYINPLVSIFLGRIFLQERLTGPQYLALLIASMGVLWLAFLGDSIPYAALLLAFSFGFYGLIKRIVSLPTVPGLALETLFMAPIAVLYLLYEYSQGTLLFLSLPPLSITVLLLSGAVTTIPLLLFSEGAKRIPLSLIGILQYISPTLQFLVGITLFGELFALNQLIGFGLVWVAVILFILSEWNNHHTIKKGAL